MKKYDFLVVGSGFSGSVFARIAADSGKRVLVVDKRSHVGGNAYDMFDQNGVLVHPYGPHIFHTNSKKVFEYLSQFTLWRFYEHKVLAFVEDEYYPIPINRTTINKLYGLNLSEHEVTAYLDSVREPRDRIQTSEDVVLNSVGRDLCDKFFRGYTKKQWGLDLCDLSAGVAARIPTRTNDDDRYFADTFQFMPANGYTVLFENMLSHANITVRTDTSMDDIKNIVEWQHMVYTGPLDAFFNYKFGRLPYRSLRFEHEHLLSDHYQTVGTVNYPNNHEYTRITEFKHITGQLCTGTSVVREYPQESGEPYYPIPRPENEVLFKRYRDLADDLKNVTFIGRLAEYRYYNMDQVVAAAMTTAKKLCQ